MKWGVLAGFIGAATFWALACNSDKLAKDPDPSPTPVWSSATPTPTFTPAEQAYCPQNADKVIPYPNDPDDGPTTGDALICIWYCTVDSINLGVVTPHEIVEVWDFDPNGQLTSYPAPPGWPFTQTPAVTACNSWPGP